MQAYKLTNFPPERKADAHKGDAGRVWIVAGSPGLTGAAYLAGQAAANTGSGLVTLAVPRALESILESKTAAVMTRGLRCTRRQALSEFSLPQILEGARDADVVAFGPGVGRATTTDRLLTRLLSAVDKPMVIDADGLNLLAGDVGRLATRKAPTILTPHPGEMARLTGLSVDAIQSDRRVAAAEFARKHKVIVLLKGPGTVVTDGEREYINGTGNAGLATGGSGDVLTGIIASLVGQGRNAIEAAAGGAYLHGLSGDMARARQGLPFPAEDLLKYLAAAVEESRKKLR